ncbi:MAG: 30S ribosomal protein S6 [Elusimicrobiota bacterium]
MAKTLSEERAYESLLICPSDTPQKTIDGFIEKIKATLEQNKGVLRSFQVWGRRRLTYQVKHHKDGLYIFIDYTSNNKGPEALKTLFRVTDFVIRFQTTDKVDLKPPYVRKPQGDAVAAGATPSAADSAVKTSPNNA